MLAKESLGIELVLKDLGLSAKAIRQGVLLGHLWVGRAGAGTEAMLPPKPRPGAVLRSGVSELQNTSGLTAG